MSSASLKSCPVPCAHLGKPSTPRLQQLRRPILIQILHGQTTDPTIFPIHGVLTPEIQQQWGKGVVPKETSPEVSWLLRVLGSVLATSLLKCSPSECSGKAFLPLLLSLFSKAEVSMGHLSALGSFSKWLLFKRNSLFHLNHWLFCLFLSYWSL